MYDIDPVTLVISLVTFGAFCAPFAYFIIKRKRQLKAQTLQMAQWAQQSGLTLGTVDYWRNCYAIALDTKKQYLLYAQFGEQEQVHLVDLTYPIEVRTIRVPDGSLTTKLDSGRMLLDELYLQIKTNMPTEQTFKLEFYNGEKFSDQMGEAILAKKWEEIVKSLTKKKPLVIG